MELINLKPINTKPIHTYFALYRVINRVKGLNEGEIITIAGNLNGGKSICAINLLADLVLEGHKCLYVSTGMTSADFSDKVLQILKCKDFKNKREFDTNKCFLEFNDFSIANIEQCIKQSNCKFVFIDAIQSLNGKIKSNMQLLKSFAQKYKCVIVCLAHMPHCKIWAEPSISKLGTSNGIVENSNQVWILSNTGMKNFEDMVFLINVAKCNRAKPFKTFLLFNEKQLVFWNIKQKDEQDFFKDYDYFVENAKLIDSPDPQQIIVDSKSNEDSDTVHPIIEGNKVRFYDSTTGIVFGNKNK